VASFFFLAAAELALNLKLTFPVSRMWQRWVRRSSKAVVHGDTVDQGASNVDPSRFCSGPMFLFLPNFPCESPLIYWNRAVSIWHRVCHGLHQISSAFGAFTKVSEAVLKAQDHDA